jgi:hypothetical protein
MPEDLGETCLRLTLQRQRSGVLEIWFEIEHSRLLRALGLRWKSFPQ